MIRKLFCCFVIVIAVCGVCKSVVYGAVDIGVSDNALDEEINTEDESSDNTETTSEDMPVVEVDSEIEVIESEKINQEDNSLTSNMVVEDNNVDQEAVGEQSTTESNIDVVSVLIVNSMLLALLCGLLFGFGVIMWVKIW